MRWPSGEQEDLLINECKPFYTLYRGGSREDMPTLAEDTVWSQALLKKLINGEPLDVSSTSADLRFSDRRLRLLNIRG